jgi:hypothetical protein
VQSNHAGQDFSATPVTFQDNVWIEDIDSSGTQLYSEYGWGWSESGPVSPYSGTRALYSPIASGMHRHAAINADVGDRLTLEAGDVIYAHVWLDPDNLPRSLLIGFQDSDGDNSNDRRVYWGENLLITNYGEDGTVTRLPMGELPAAGGWVRLEVSAADLDLEGETLRGYGLYAYDGRVAFDQIGKSSEPDEPLIEYSISGQVVSDGVGLAGVEMTSAAGAACTPSDTNGDYRCDVAQGWSGGIAPAASGYSFEPAEHRFENVQSNHAGQDFSATPVTFQDNVWIEDIDSSGTQLYSEYGWGWSESGPVSPYSGTRALYSPIASGMHRHAAINADVGDRLTLEAGDVIYAHVWLDPDNLPRSLLIGFQDSDGDNSNDRRVYWGENLLITNYGEDGTVTRLPMGELPAAGGWVRLEVSAADLDLEGETLRGYGLYAYDGRVAFDQIGRGSQL